ncbi:Shugoshin N-terminal coiled-coil region [Microdochium nivale]|nr:Shugoshin N-terminal coiled-coil region [Microdochium nivale]
MRGDGGLSEQVQVGLITRASSLANGGEESLELSALGLLWHFVDFMTAPKLSSGCVNAYLAIPSDKAGQHYALRQPPSRESSYHNNHSNHNRRIPPSLHRAHDHNPIFFVTARTIDYNSAIGYEATSCHSLMARLNEPVVAPDGLEILRRRFLRQNRDIARINSTQSLRIRSLENECARMLSENLQLRGRVLHLESEIRESSAQRIADHALEIRDKMEAQLLEWGTLLASLGNEPIPQHRSPRAHKKPRLQPSPQRSSPFQWQRREHSRETMREMEDAAYQEGRLAPIWENKSCPRETLNREEILALREEADEVSNSPDFTAPISRSMQLDPVKLDLPTRSVQLAMEAALEDESVSGMTELHDSRPNTPSNSSTATSTMNVCQSSSVSDSDEPKSTLKRKARTDEEKELAETTKQAENTPRGKILGVKPSGATNNHTVRPLKSLPTIKKDAKSKASDPVLVGAQRRPLGMKSSNDPIASPRKAGKPAGPGDTVKPKADTKYSSPAKALPKAKREGHATTPSQIPAPVLQAIPVVSLVIDPPALSIEPSLNTPFSPESSASREDATDTPPPAHISLLGETARASRRARSAVSYAEPNLRDKMRRPTKELFDAVSGEGKTIRRHSQSKRDDLPSALGAISMSASSEKSQVWRDFPQKHITEATESNPAAGIAASPLAMKTKKEVVASGLPISLAAEKKKRSAGSECESSQSKNSNRRSEDTATRDGDDPMRFDGQDVYDFPASTPEDDNKQLPADGLGTRRIAASRHSRARRLSSIPGEESANSGSDDTKATKSSDGKAAARKRASMAAPKKSKMSLGQSDLDSTTDGDSQASILSTSSCEAVDTALKDRGALRRRSMML